MRVQQILSRGPVWNPTLHLGFSLTLVEGQESFWAPSSPQSGLSPQSRVHAASLGQHSWHWAGMFVQALLGSLGCWLESKQLPTQLQGWDVCCVLSTQPCLPCPAEGLPPEPAGTEDVLVIPASLEAPWHLQTRDCLHKNRGEEKCGDEGGSGDKKALGGIFMLAATGFPVFLCSSTLMKWSNISGWKWEMKGVERLSWGSFQNIVLPLGEMFFKEWLNVMIWLKTLCLQGLGLTLLHPKVSSAKDGVNEFFSSTQSTTEQQWYKRSTLSVVWRAFIQNLRSLSWGAM